MQFAGTLKLLAQGRHQARRQHGHAILGALAIPDQDLVAFERHILHPQVQAFHDAQAGTIQQAGNERAGAVEPRQHGLHLGAGQNHRQPLRRLGRLDIVEPGQFKLQHLAVKEQQRTLGLILGRGGDPPRHRQMGQKFPHLGGSHVARVALAKMPKNRLIQSRYACSVRML